jgi:hypothetical protein
MKTIIDWLKKIFKRPNKLMVPINPDDIFWEVYIDKIDLPPDKRPINGKNKPIYKLTWGFDWYDNKILMDEEQIKRLIKRLQDEVNT